MKAIVTGVLGQAGSLMAEYLIKHQSIEVYGLVRRYSNINTRNIRNLKNHPGFKLVSGDLTDPVSLNKVIKDIKPEYFFNFAAQSYVGTSWKLPLNHFETNATAIIHILESILEHCPSCRFVNMGTSECFGDVIYSPQDLNHPFRPRSPYGASKCAAAHIVKIYRESYNLFVIQPINFNFEGPRRGEEFVTKKIVRSLVNLKHELLSPHIKRIKPLKLGNLKSVRDWSDAEDIVRGIWKTVDKSIITEPEEYLFASGESHSVEEFIEIVLDYLGISYTKINENKNPTDNEDIIKYVHEDIPIILSVKEFYRPNEVVRLLGNYEKAKQQLDWSPAIHFDKLVEKMVVGVETDDIHGFLP